MITKWITFTVASEYCEAFSQALTELENESQAEEGCVLYKAYSVKGENSFTVLESWADEDCFEAHRQAAHIKTFKNSCGHMIEQKSSLELTPTAKEK